MKHISFYELIFISAEIWYCVGCICRGCQQMNLTLLYPAGTRNKVLGKFCILDVPVSHGKILSGKISSGDLQIPVIRPDPGSAVF